MPRPTRRGAVLLVAALIVLLSAACLSWDSPDSSTAARGPLPTVPPGILGEGNASAGQELFASKGCVACHKIDGEGGSAGPELDGIGNPTKRPLLIGELENTPENLWRWITSPQEVKPRTLMASQPLTPQEAADLVAYLETLE